MKQDILLLLSNISSELFLTYKQNTLLKDMTIYNKCYSAIYLLEDISETFDYYKNCEESKLTLGAKYLMIYGIFEALFLQQDALNDLIESLGFETINFKEDYPQIYEIREVRHDIAGHPTCRTSEQYTTYLSRPDLSIKKITYEETQYNKFVEFDIISSIKMQEKFVKNRLDEVLKKLMQEKKEHIKKFKDDKLMDCFEMFTYLNGKIHSKGHFYTQNDSMGFNLVNEILEKLKEKLNIRFVNWENTNFAYDIKFTEKIHRYLLSKPEIINEESEENEFLKINLLENLFTHLEDLKDMAQEVDNDYQNQI